MKFLKYALMMIVSFSFASCGGGGSNEPDVDNTAPTLTITAPTASSTVNAGDNLSVNFTAKDNIALSSYTLTVAYSGAKTAKTVQEFSFNSNTDNDASGNALPQISGTNSTISFQMEILDNAKPGNYKLEVTVKDSSNNPKKSDVTFEVL